jgi:hypothetical protein
MPVVGPRCTREDIPTLLLSFIKLIVPGDEKGTGTAQLPVPSMLRNHAEVFSYLWE